MRIQPTKRTKILMLILAAVSMVSFLILNYAKNKKEDADRLWAKLQADILVMRSSRHLGPPTNGVIYTVHDEYEDSFIESVDKKKGMVQVLTVESKMRITFRPAGSAHFQSFNKGWIAPVTFKCGKKPGVRCDLSQPYKLYISNALVEPIEVIEKTTR